jgi:hypothetical protein
MKEQNKYYIYEYTRLDTGEVFYVGKGSENRYLSLRGRNHKFINVISSIEYKVEKVLEGLTEEDAYEAEVSFIAYRRSIGQSSCNIADGGVKTIFFRDEEYRRKMSIIKKEYMSNPENRKKISEATKKGMTELVKARLSGIKKGKLSKRKGTTHSIESKKKISLSGIGRPSALRKEIISSEGLIFESITAAAKYYKCLRTSITNILTKRNNSIRNGISFNYYKRGILWE